jgi:hypothetical protein
VTGRKRNTILAISLTILGLGAIYAVVALPNVPQMKEGFHRVKRHDTKAEVIELMGQPSEISGCHEVIHSGVHQELKENCVEMYYYFGFLEKWDVVLDKDGNVISKSHQVSH